jgi:hypothetical protein
MRLTMTTVSLAGLLAVTAFAQPPAYPPPELDRLVARIALYPDPLIAQIMAAATFPDQVPDAAHWADQHHYLAGDSLAAAIQADRLPWDPSVQALLPFPAVLEMMASDPSWTDELGNAFLSQQQQVMDAVQRQRRRAYDYGYLRSNAQVIVNTGPYIEILPARPGLFYVPFYDPLVVYAPPRPGFFVGGAIRFGFGFTIGAAYAPWGWGYNRFVWNTHTVIINNAPWQRTWVNRGAYVHPYEPARRYEGHELHERSERERESYRGGRERFEEHDRRR